MAEYIEREAIIRAVRRQRGPCRSAAQNQMLDQLEMDIGRIQAADVAPVVHGKWVPSGENPGFLVCSACGDCYVVDEWADGKKWRYCPACGAKMDGKGEEA